MQDSEAENDVVHRKPDGGHYRHEIPLGRQAVQNAKDHKINHVAVGVADGDAKHGHDRKAEAGEQGVNKVEHRGDEQEQKL